MQIVPTLNFGGNCREAIQMYEKAYNGKISCIITYGEADDPAYNPLLKEGSKTIYQMEATPYSSCWVVFVDKFGIRWGIMTEQTDR